MSSRQWQWPDIKRFDLGRVSDRKTEFLLAGALLAIILASLYMSLRKVVRPGGPMNDGLVHLICVSCKHEFEISHEEAANAAAGLDRYGGPGTMTMRGAAGPLADCRNPECGRKMSAWIARQCRNPDCEKYYVSETRVAAYNAQQAGGDEPVEVLDICSHCKVDQAQLRRQRAQEGRR